MTIEGQTLALAGMAQALQQVEQLANLGRCEEQVLGVAVASVLRLDAESASDVFGGADAVLPGLVVVADELEGKARDVTLIRLVVAVMHLERQVARRPALREALADGIRAVQRGASAMGNLHEGVLARLDELYVQTVGSLRPRVMVRGNALHLTQPRVVARIRTLLLAALRAAVLWRQMGGNRLRLVFSRARMAGSARELASTAIPPRPD